MRSGRALATGVLCALSVASCSDGEPAPPAPFSNPERVTVTGYGGDAMEPFVSRDGAYLFFNSAGGPSDKELFFATAVDATTFQYQGPITAINSATVDGVPTLDDASRFYYVTLASYGADLATIHSGVWTGSTVTSSAPLVSLTIPTPLILYFDVEVTADGSALYLSEGDFTGGGSVPSAADIVLFVDTGSGFVRDPAGAAIMANVNTGVLEYAPALSVNQLELFFTRLDPGTLEARIYQASRASITSPFDVPRPIAAIDGFVEAPALSPDERSLYYHRLNPATNAFELHRVTRP